MKKIVTIFIAVSLILINCSLPVSATNSKNNMNRYTVLVLDTSGSSTFENDGVEIYTADTAIDYVKEASSRFLDSVLSADGNNYVAVVSYKEYAEVISDFSTDYKDLRNRINNLSEGNDVRDMADGIWTATSLLEEVDDPNAVKNIVLFTTGMTNEGDYDYDGYFDEDSTGSSWYRINTDVHLYAYANMAYSAAEEAKSEGIFIYTIGLFQTMDDMPEEGWDIATFFRETTEELATSWEYYYPVYDPEDLEFTFGDVADEIIDDDTYEVTFDGYNAVFDPWYFSKVNKSTECNPDLAMLSGILSWAVFGDDGKPTNEEVYNSIGISSSDIMEKGDRASNSSLCFSIARKKIFVDGEDSNLLIVSARGTVTDYEKFGDHFTKADSYFYGQNAYGLPYKFEEQMMELINSFCDHRPEMREQPLKILITGYSLGGAAANLLAARFTMFSDSGSWWAPLLDKDDIYAYTFGAIDSIDSDALVSSGFENIHNITNFNDSYGPNGWPAFVSAAGRSRYGKYGHIDMFYSDVDKGKFGENQNHMIWTYLDAVEKNPEGVAANKIYYNNRHTHKVVSIHCPVDVEVYREGKLVGRVVDNKVDYNVTSLPICISGDQKYVAIMDDAEYSVKMTATDEGVMKYYISDAGTGNNAKIFRNVQLMPKKVMESSFSSSESVKDVRLLVMSENGGIVSEVQENGKEKIHEHCFGEWQIVKPATELDTGQRSRICSICGSNEKQEIAQLSPTLKIVKILKPKAAKKSATIKWKKVSKKNLKKIKKIQIQYSTDKNFEKNVKSKYAKATKSSYKLTKLKSKKKYYVRIRAYTKSGSKVHVSKWSAKRSIKVK